MAEYFIGTSGWHYDDWRGRLYPQDLPRSAWLEYYSRQFATVEINNSFYRLPSEKTFEKWKEETSSDFVFAVKASRYITHVKRLKDTGEVADNFLNKARLLEDKLGPILYQLPPTLHRDDGRLEAFLAALPAGYRNVIEFRHSSWLEVAVFNILERYNAALCVFDMPGLTCPLVVTAAFAYIRFHGSESMFSSNYTKEQLVNWADKIKRLDTKTVYVYFNNDIGGYAVDNARTIREYLEGSNGNKK